MRPKTKTRTLNGLFNATTQSGEKVWVESHRCVQLLSSPCEVAQ